METMAEWFGLKDGHRDFHVENDVHASLLFARSELDGQLRSILRKAFRTGNPPKFVLYGDWGVGKTHTMRHISWFIDQTEGYDANVIFIELPDIKARSTFQVAHAALLDAIGLNRVKSWVVQYQTKYQAESHEKIHQFTQSADVASAFLTLIGYGDTTRICWDWLRGETLSGTDARSVGLPPVLDQSLQLVNVLRMLGRISMDIDGKSLVLMLDEATTLKSVTNGDAIAHWVKAFKILADQVTKELGFIVSASFRDPDDMPDALSDQQIRSRFGESHYIQLLNFPQDEATQFTRSLLVEWIDPVKRTTLEASFAGECDGEQIDAESFPFTAEGLERFIEYACRNGNVTNPRDIQKALDDKLNRAIDDGRHILSGPYVMSLIAEG
jgi:Cdc6-like AAA superfamily ATPase